MAEKLHISLRDEWHSVDVMGVWTRVALPPLGFGARLDPSRPKNVDRVKETLNWAYGGGYEDRNGMIWTKHWDWATRTDEFKPAIHQPVVITNEPLTGFKVTTSVTRSSTANKFWRILDPRGFELEISTANMEELLMTCAIAKGEFIGQYMWDYGKNGIGRAKLVNVPIEEDGI
jgi:hypothetical protein